MSLDWDCSKCPAGSMPANAEEHGARECLIWGSISIDIGRITEENASEVLFRYRFLERIDQSITTQPMTMEAIQRWIGLRTNVVTLDRKAWLEKVAKIVKTNLARDVWTSVQSELKSVASTY